MQVKLTEGARAFLGAKGHAAVTVASVVISSCCAGPLPPEVKPGAPGDAEGFTPLQVDGVTVFYDSLLAPRPELTIDVKDYGRYQELFVAPTE
ncbi:MAG TPA: CC/Se motif family (seleno)protein [Symbiobacteriaceae bacterium]|jgi:hypothetical protein